MMRVQGMTAPVALIMLELFPNRTTRAPFRTPSEHGEVVSAQRSGCFRPPGSCAQASARALLGQLVRVSPFGMNCVIGTVIVPRSPLMSPLSVPSWWSRQRSFSQTCPRRNALSDRRRRRPYLGLLECRCVPSTVTNLADAGPGSLRDALATTPAGGTVDFQPGLSGTITLTSATLAITQDVTIAGPGAGVITVSGNNLLQVFNIPPAVTVTMSGLTIANGNNSTGNGGGIANSGVLALAGCAVSNNSAGSFSAGYLYGGGIFNSGTVTITDATFAGNAGMSGGGIYNAGTLTVTASLFSGNSAQGGFEPGNGAGIANDTQGVATIVRSLFSDNSASVFSGDGGGILNDGTMTVMDSTVSGNNTAGARVAAAGGIGNTGILTIIDSTISGNSVTAVFSDSGGGIFNSGTLVINQATISGNSVQGSPAPGSSSPAAAGGGLANTGMVTILDSTISGNSAIGVEEMGSPGVGGGIYNSTGTLSIQNTILAGNSAFSASDVAGALTSLGHNLIGIGDGGSGYANTDLVGTAANPLDPLLGTLQDNGGPTQTMAVLPGSPALAAGAPTDMEWDQRGPGYPRLVNSATDIGAYEVQDGVGGALAAHAARLASPNGGPENATSQAGAPTLPATDTATARVPPGQATAVVDQVFASRGKQPSVQLGLRLRPLAAVAADLGSLDLSAAKQYPG
jgi:hypothetical protein